MPAGLAFDLAHQIPERHVKRANGANAKAAAARHGRAAVHLLPQAFDIARVLTDQHFGQAEPHDVRTRCLDHGAGDPRVGVCFAYSDVPRVSVDFHDQIVLRRRTGVCAEVRNEEHEAFNLGDFHGVILLLDWHSSAGRAPQNRGDSG